MFLAEKMDVKIKVFIRCGRLLTPKFTIIIIYREAVAVLLLLLLK
jgi:hypothetical protein